MKKSNLLVMVFLAPTNKTFLLRKTPSFFLGGGGAFLVVVANKETSCEGMFFGGPFFGDVVFLVVVSQPKKKNMFSGKKMNLFWFTRETGAVSREVGLLPFLCTSHFG